MFSKVRRFSNLLKVSVLSSLTLMLLSAVCYGQQTGQTTILVSIPKTTNNPATGYRGGTSPAISGDGRSISYTTTSFNSAAIVTNITAIGDAEPISDSNVNSRLEEGRDTSLSGDGLLVAFRSNSRNLLGDINQPSGPPNIYLGTRGSDIVTLVSRSINSSSQQANGTSFSPVVSRDRRFIAYVSNAIDITSESSQAGQSIYLYDIQGRTNRIISRTSSSFLQSCFSPAISSDGSTVAFISQGRVFTKTTNNDSPAVQLPMMQGQSAQFVSISSDGNVVAYNVPGFVIVSPVSGSGLIRIPISNFTPSPNGRSPIALSGNGSFVAVSTTDSVIMSDTNGASDIYVYNVQSAIPILVSVPNFDTNQAISTDNSFDPAISDDGRTVTFASNARLTLDTPNFNDTNIYAVVGSGAGGAGGAGVLNLGPVCIATGRAIAPNAIEVFWGFPGAHNDQLKDFKVEVNHLEGSEYKPIAKVPADGKANYVDTNLKPNTRYTYRLWIENPKGFAYSVDFTVKTPKIKKNK